MIHRTVVVALLAAAGAGLVSAQVYDPERKREQSSVYRDGVRWEEKGDLAKAVETYKAARDRDAATVWAARAGHRIALCLERQGQVEPALAAHQEVVAAFPGASGEIAEVVKASEEKVRLKGVDVWLGQYRDALAAPVPDKDKLLAIRDAVLALDAAAVPGLLGGLADPTPRLRGFAAEICARVADEAALTAVAGLLATDDASARAGASLALRHALAAHEQAAALDRQAQDLEQGLPEVDAGNRELIDKMHAQAAEIRHNLPAGLAADSFTAALTAALASPHPDARAEAARTLGQAGAASAAGPLAERLGDPDPSVREAAARSLGRLGARDAADKLQSIVQYEPEKETGDGVDWQITAGVRHAAAEALGAVGLITSCPALIEALEDNDAVVRTAAAEALRRISGLDFSGEADGRKKLATDPANDPDAVKGWKDWWEKSAGVEVLVRRFRAFSKTWKSFAAPDLYDEESFRHKTARYAREIPDEAKREAFTKRADAAWQSFQASKKRFQDDIVSLGAPAVPHLLVFLGGEDAPGATEKGAFDASVRLFVAETLGRLTDADLFGKLVDAVAGESSSERKAGAALALGRVPADAAGADRSRAVGALGGALAGDPVVKWSAANALGLIGDASAGGALAGAAQDADPVVQVEVLRAIRRCKAADARTVLMDILVKGDKADAREAAAEALVVIPDPITTPSLVRARMDLFESVQRATARAVVALAESSPGNAGSLVDTLVLMINPLKKTEMPESQNSLMRAGAALALGDIPEGPRGPHLDKIVTALCYRLIDEKRPKYVHDPDQEVRAGAVEALKNYGDKRALVVEALVASLADPFQKTRCLALEALKTATGQDDMGYKCDGTLQVIQDGQRKWQGWWDGQKANWKP